VLATWTWLVLRERQRAANAARTAIGLMAGGLMAGGLMAGGLMAGGLDGRPVAGAGLLVSVDIDGSWIVAGASWSDGRSWPRSRHVHLPRGRLQLQPVEWMSMRPARTVTPPAGVWWSG
jgi:hypothetical protein